MPVPGKELGPDYLAAYIEAQERSTYVEAESVSMGQEVCIRVHRMDTDYSAYLPLVWAEALLARLEGACQDARRLQEEARGRKG